MVRERVFIKVGKRAAEVNCRFVFHNDGPACDVRIGFPDNGEEANVEVLEDETKPKPFVGLKPFYSWVDDKPVSTAILPVQGKAMSWHVKVVHFDAHQTHVIRDYYGLWIGGQATSIWRDKATGDNYYIWTLPYVVSSGASWKGPIGEAKVIVQMPFCVSAQRVSYYFKLYDYPRLRHTPRSHVYYRGFTRARVEGRNLIFDRRHFKPTEEDDLMVSWRQTKAETQRQLYPPGIEES